jgi:uncharacterized protein YjbI with pentapeptide repeats
MKIQRRRDVILKDLTLVPQTCTFRTPDGKACSRLVRGPDPYCSLHYGCNHKLTEELPENPHFANDFLTAVQANEGDWRGFVFPPGIRLPKEIPFAVDARGSRLSSFEQDQVTFKAPADFSDAIFKGGLTLKGVIFEDVVTFDRCRFEGPVDVLNVQCKKAASFYRADFAGRTILRANFRASVNFNEAVFRDGVVFAGWRIVTARLSSALALSSTQSERVVGRRPTLGEQIRVRVAQAGNSISRLGKRLQKMLVEVAGRIRGRVSGLRHRFAKTDSDAQVFKMFEAEGQLQGVVFFKPDQTLFSQVDLSKVFFRGTNLRGVRFLGVTWWQSTFGRNGLYDEVFIRMSKDGPFRHLSLPVLEETCRNARVALEENRSFNVASDFYVAEMEAARSQQKFWERHVFSVTALYRSVSRYGTSVGTALWMLFLIYFLHMISTVALESPKGTVLEMQHISEAAVRSLKVLLLQATVQATESRVASISSTQTWLDLVFRLLGPIQLAMVALAFRSRIKRH